MSRWSLRHLAEAAVPQAGSPWGVTPRHYGAIRELADHARAMTGLTISRASDFCAAFDIRFRQSFLASAPGDTCRADGLIVYGNDLPSDEREIVLLHGVAHRLLSTRHRPVEFFGWLLTVELAVPRDLLLGLGFARFVEHHPHLPPWAIEFAASLHEIRVPLRSELCLCEEVAPDSATGSKEHR